MTIKELRCSCNKLLGKIGNSHVATDIKLKNVSIAYDEKGQPIDIEIKCPRCKANNKF